MQTNRLAKVNGNPRPPSRQALQSLKSPPPLLPIMASDVSTRQAKPRLTMEKAPLNLSIRVPIQQGEEAHSLLPASLNHPCLSSSSNSRTMEGAYTLPEDLLHRQPHHIHNRSNLRSASSQISSPTWDCILMVRGTVKSRQVLSDWEEYISDRIPIVFSANSQSCWRILRSAGP